jgi:hypothetical protein
MAKATGRKTSGKKKTNRKGNNRKAIKNKKKATKSPKKASKTTGKAAWTVMVYLAGDNDLDSAGVVDLGEMKAVGSSERINLLAQFDRAGPRTETRRFLLRKGTALGRDVVMNLGETNMGDPKVLKDFLVWGAKNYPAERYMVVIWNHGAGWDDENVYRAVRGGLKRGVAYKQHAVGRPSRGAKRAVPLSRLRSVSKRKFKRALFSSTVQQAVEKRAIAFDDDAQDFLDNIELKRVLTGARKVFGGKIDVLGMDACLMNMAEVAYQVRNTAQVLVGSQEVEPTDGWPYHTILRDLARKPNATPAELGKVIVDRYLASYGASEGVTQSALDLALCRGLEGAIDKLASVLIGALPGDDARLGMLQARQAVRDYDTRDYIDLVHFCQLLRKFSGSAAIHAACDAVDSAAVKLVLASGFKGAGVKNSNGVSIYFPEGSISPLYAKLDFARNNKWNEMLRAYFDAVNA